MNSIKSLIYILLAVLGLIFIYNYIFVPMFSNSGQTNGMGMMGEHQSHQANYNYNSVDLSSFVLLAIFLGVLALIFIHMKPFDKHNVTKKCHSCGNQMEDDKWKVCPICGTPIKAKRGDD